MHDSALFLRRTRGLYLRNRLEIEETGGVYLSQLCIDCNLSVFHRANEPLLLIAGIPISQQSAALLGVLVLALIAVLFRFIENYTW